MALTLEPGTLIVASAYTDPPFDVLAGSASTGFDLGLMGAMRAT
jgi:hypothetical protein